MRKLRKGVRSVLTIVGILYRECMACLRDLLRGDTKGAGEHLRTVIIAVHDDILQGLTALQRRLKFWSVPARTIDRILVVKLDRIGDMVATTPVFDALRAVFPQARIDVVGHPVPLSLLVGDERVTERIPCQSWLYHPITPLPPGPRTWGLILRLLWRRYPLVVYLRGAPSFLVLGLLSRLASAKFVPGEPVVDRYLKPLEALYGPVSNRQPRLRIQPSAAARAVELLQATKRFGGPVVTIHATASQPTKMWPAERFALLADRLTAELQADVHFLGGPADQTLLETITRQAASRPSFHCKLPLAETVGLIAASDLFVGNDSGLAHVAAAVGTPLILIWGPVCLNMARPTAPAERCRILYHDLPCRPACPETHCTNPVHLECLTRTQTEDVLQAARELLRSAKTNDSSQRPRPSPDWEGAVERTSNARS